MEEANSQTSKAGTLSLKLEQKLNNLTFTQIDLSSIFGNAKLINDYPASTQNTQNNNNTTNQNNYARSSKTDEFDHVYYNYFSSDELKQVLLQTQLVVNCNFIVELVDVVCAFCAYIEWSHTDISSNYTLFDSTNGTIQYAAITSNHFGMEETYPGGENATIFLNDWIDIDSDLTYKYVLKVVNDVKNTGRLYSLFLKLGLATERYSMELTSKLGECLGFGNKDSICWMGSHIRGLYSNFCFNSNKLKACDGFRSNSIVATSVELNKYIVLQVNMASKVVRVISTAFQGFKPNGRDRARYMQCKLPQKMIENARFIRMGVTLMHSDINTCAVGIVRVRL